VTAVQTINTPGHQAKTRWHGNRVGHFGISHREYAALARFSTAADKAGVKTSKIGRGPFNQGCLLQLSSSNHNYEVLVDGAGQVLLGSVKSGQRIKLCVSGTNTEASWEKLLQALRNNEGRA
jgi:hypothetical protein